jgi:hypothetical protein
MDRLNQEIAFQPDETQERRQREEHMFSIFGQHNSKGPMELDVSLLRSSEDILKSLIWYSQEYCE